MGNWEILMMIPSPLANSLTFIWLGYFLIRYRDKTAFHQMGRSTDATLSRHLASVDIADNCHRAKNVD